MTHTGRCQQPGSVPTFCHCFFSVMGVDLFFHLPKHEDPVFYTYHTLKVATTYTVVPDVTQSFQQISCDADWMGQMSLFLNQGWKLVDICMDTTALADGTTHLNCQFTHEFNKGVEAALPCRYVSGGRGVCQRSRQRLQQCGSQDRSAFTKLLNGFHVAAFGMKSVSSTIDTLWIFEKEATKVNNTAPEYEGVIVEYLHKVKVRAIQKKQVVQSNQLNVRPQNTARCT